MLTDSESALARAVLIHGPISRSALDPPPRPVAGEPHAPGEAVPRSRASSSSSTTVATASVGRPSGPSTSRPDLGRFVGVKLTGDAPLRRRAPTSRARCSRERGARAASARPGSGVARASPERFEDLGRRRNSRASGCQHRRQPSATAASSSAPFLGWTRRADLGSELSTASSASPSRSRTTSSRSPRRSDGSGSAAACPGSRSSRSAPASATRSSSHGEVVHSREAGSDSAGTSRSPRTGPSATRATAAAPRRCSRQARSRRRCRRRCSARSTTTRCSRSRRRATRRRGRSTDAAADALGRFVALAANLTLQPAVVLAGEGIGLFAVARGPGARGDRRGPRSAAPIPIEIHVDESGFSAWARGAAAVAIQAAVDRHRPRQVEQELLPDPAP